MYKIIESIECELHIIKLLADKNETDKIISFADKIQKDIDALVELMLNLENKRFTTTKRVWAIFQKI